jgi:hypothetical protein
MSVENSLDTLTQHHWKSSDDVTVIGSNDSDILEKARRLSSQERVILPKATHEDFPDGGLTAWLVVFGVSELEARSTLVQVPHAAQL